VALEDGQLLARYESERDEAAFEALIGRHGPMVLTICRAVLRNEHDVEDAFQATFLVLARKAGSIRGSDALGGWLHRVAYRASVQAGLEASRRRRKEAEASAMAQVIASRPDHDHELGAILHEEIDRLPEGQRLPVVLCDLEGLTYEQAAHRLRWTVPTLRNRLARGRQNLKARLTRRGVMPSAIVALLASSASSAVPPTLARMALSAGTGGSASAGATLLAHTLLRGMLMTQIKIASAAALAALALASAGLIAAGGGRAIDDAKPVEKQAAKPEVPVQEARKPTELTEIRGIVVAPDYKPVAGAKVRAAGLFYGGAVVGPSAETTSGPDGRFRLRMPPRHPSQEIGYAYDYPWVVASAPGFGLGWTRNAFEPGPSGESTIQLVQEGPPIEGKVIDLDGRPVAGARVRVKAAWVNAGRKDDDWIAKLRAQEVPLPALGLLGLTTPIEVAAGADGRFRLTEVGGDRVATLLLSGPTIATTEVQVIAYDGPEIRSTPKLEGQRGLVVLPPETTVFHAPRFQVVAGPTRPIEGVIRDKDTGRPIEGLSIQAAVFEVRRLNLNRDVVARTDAEGRYRILGMPAAPAYRLFLSRAPGQSPPYPNATLKTPDDPPGTGPIRFDIALKRGVVVRGRVTNKATGQPVPGSVEPYIFADNPFAAEFPNNAETLNGLAQAGPDGRFEVVTTPGRGLLAFKATGDHYVNGLGAEAIPGFDPARGQFPTRGRPCVANLYHVVTAVDFDPEAVSATVDLQVDPGRSLALAVVDPDGHPVVGLKVVGASPQNLHLPEPQETRPIWVRSLDPSKPRRVTVLHNDRKLVGSIWLRGDESGARVVHLVPWGSVVGRFLDAEGDPISSRRIDHDRSTSTKPEEAGILPGAAATPPPTTDEGGRFRFDRLVPGLKYSAYLPGISPSPGLGFKDVTVAPGETKDLGDLKVQPFQP
jgi:RNA polymerase sigma factor (sigma-70 family)